MDREKAKAKIEQLAVELRRDGSQFSRADLAYELSECGVKGDSNEIGKLVWEAYQKSRNKEAIRVAFTNNAGNRSLVDSMKVEAALENDDTSTAISVANAQLTHADDSISQLSQSIKQALSDVVAEHAGGVIATVSGTASVDRIKNEANVMFENYSNLVSSYEETCASIQDITSTFTSVRSDIEKTYRQYSMALVDVFGDSIKVVAPEMFDFSTIEWLDVQGMLQQIVLQHGSMMSRCTNLICEISESFKSSVQSSLSLYKGSGSGEIGLIMAAINLVGGHYLSVHAKTSALKEDMLVLKNSMRRDATNIKGDMMRLTKIFKTINDVYIPEANIFYKNADNILNKELKSLLDSIYGNEKVAKLKSERDALLEEGKELECAISDIQANIAYYTKHVDECTQLLNEMKDSYTTACSAKPSRPFFLVNWITFGSTKRTYNQNLLEWSQTWEPIVRRYEALQVDLTLERDDKTAQEKLLKEHTARYNAIKPKLDHLTREIMAALSVDDKTKRKVLGHLKDIVRLLQVAKHIMERKLDARDVSTVKIKDFGDVRLPNEVEQKLNNFTSKALSLVSEEQDVVELASGVFNQWLKLELMKQNDAKSEKHYNQQLEKLKQQFKAEIDAVDDKAALLRNVMAKINTAASPEECKRGLMMLADLDNANISDADWDSFLSGNKTITI